MPKGYNTQFESLIEDFKNYLENEDESKIISTLQLLFHGKQSNTIPFAREVSQKLKKFFKVSYSITQSYKRMEKNIQILILFF